MGASAPPQEEILIKYLADSITVVNDVLRSSSGRGASPSKIQGKSISSSPVTRRAKSDVVVHANSMQRAGQLAQQQALLKQQPYGQPQLSPSKPGASAHAPNARATPLISSSGRATQSAAASPMGRANSGTFGGTLLPNSGPINNMLTHAMRKGPPAPPSTSSRHGPHHPVTKAAAAAPPKLQAIPERGKAPPPVNSQPQAHSHPPQSPSKPRLSPPQPHASSPPPAMPPFGSRSAIMPPTEAALRQLPLADRPGTYRHVPSEVATHAGWWGRSNSGGAASNVSYPRTAVTESNSVTPSELAAWESRMSDLEKTIREERTRRARFEEELKTLQQLASSRGGLSTGAVATAGVAKPHAGYEQAAARARQ